MTEEDPYLKGIMERMGKEDLTTDLTRKVGKSPAFSAPYGTSTTATTPTAIPGVLSLDVLMKSLEEAEKLLKRQQEEGKYVVLLPDGQCFVSKDPASLAALLLQKANNSNPFFQNVDFFSKPRTP